MERTTSRRKRKSSEYREGDFSSPKTQRKQAVNDENVNSKNVPGLMAPGWSKQKGGTPSSRSVKAGTPRSSRKLRDKMKEFRPTPQTFGFQSVDDISQSVFGNSKERDEKLKAVLKRIKPTQRIFGYAKEYHELETKRLANGIKDMNMTIDKFLESSRENERKVLSFVQTLELKTDHAEALRSETEAKVEAYSTEMTALKQKITALQTDIGQEKSKISDYEKKVIELEAKEKEFESDLEAAKAEKGKVRDEYEKRESELGQKHLEEIKVKDSELSSLREQLTENSRQMADAEKKCNEYILTLSKLEEKDKLHTIEIERAKAQQDLVEKQNQSLEEKLKSRDSHLDKALETFQENQKFSQERIASLADEKQKLEEKVMELSSLNKELLEEKSTLLKDKDSLESKLATLDETSKKAYEQLEEDSKRVQLNLELNVKRISSEFEASRKDWQKSKAEMVQENETLKKNIGELTKAKQNLESEYEALKTTYAQGGQTSEQQLQQLYEANKEREMLKSRVTTLEQVQEELRQAKESIFKYHQEARAMRNEIQDLKGTVRVVARVRPSKEKDTEGGDEKSSNKIECGVDDKSMTLSMENETSSGSTVRLHEFSFNHVFQPKASQLQVFDEVSTFVQSALDGYNVCLFSYGQTGSGKTYTMTGDHYSSTDQGIIPRSITHIMEYKKLLESQGWEISLEATFLEIYNEKIRDLLVESSKANKGMKHEIRDSKTEIIVSGLKRESIMENEDVHHLLVKAENNRSVAATDSNLHSSRSHSVFTLFINGRNVERQTKVVGSLSMCDLAGSERVSKSGVKGERLKETQAINKSLSSLADVFTSLSKKSTHIPYRNSKLTQLVRPCFSGEGKVLMIVNLSSDKTDLSETLCSLRFASHVNQTEVGRAKKNISSMSSKRSSSICSDGRSRKRSHPSR